MKKDTEQTPGQAVVDFVGLFDPFRHALQTVLMVPETVGPMALLINEEPGGIDVGNFRHPGNGNTGQGADTVGDNQTGINRLGYGRGNPEIEPWRCDQAQVRRIGEKLPSRKYIGL